MSSSNLASFTDILGDVDEIGDSQPLSLTASNDSQTQLVTAFESSRKKSTRPLKHTGQHGDFRSVEELDPKYRSVFTYPYFNLVQSGVIEDAVYSDKSIVVCAPTGSGKTVVFEMAIVQLLMELEDKNYTEDFKIIYMAPVKALCTERLTEWYPKFTRLGLLCIEVTGDTEVDFSQLKPYRIIITTPEKWDMLTRRWRDHRGLVEVIKLFLIDEVHILNDETRGPVLEAVVSRMKTIESSAQSVYRIEQLQKQYQKNQGVKATAAKETYPPRIRFVAVSATVSNPDDVAAWLGTSDKPAVYYKFGDECRPVKLRRVVEGYPCPEGTSIFKFDIILNYKLWPVIQKYYDGKPTLIFCNTRKSVALTAETLSKEITVTFSPEQKAKLTALASTIKNKKLQVLVSSGVGCHHAGLLYEERVNIEQAFRNRDLPILITTTTLAMGVNLPAHLVIVKNTQQYVNGAYQEYSISTVLQMVGRAGRPQFDTEATAVIMTRLSDKPRYQALVGGSEPLQSYLHKRLAENLNSEAALGTVADVAQCVQWLRSTFLCVRAARDPKRYLGLPPAAPAHLISKKIEELCVKAMNGLASSGLITMDEASCIESTDAGRLMSVYYLDLETMKHIMKIEGTETLERLLCTVCESHELADMHLRVDERRALNALNRNQAAATIRFPMKGKISTRQMKLNCIIQAVLGCLPIPDPSLHQEAMKIMRIADRVCKCLVAYVTRAELVSTQPQCFSSVLNSLVLAKCIAAHLWETSPYVSRQLKGIGPTFSTLLATAGKINFMLLEESHPRDLERIMNKSAPAGNILRKQVSLLPKYQLTMTPTDEKKVVVQLTLLNQAYLAENIEHLTAGENHKCHVVAGDSENHLLLLASFREKDLLGVYDGTMTYEIIRKHCFEHKIFVHCISSNFVGIDAQCEYLFKNLEPFFSRREASITHPTENTTSKKTSKKQTNITDTFKERKRKNTDSIAQSKEKKKRDNDLMEKFKYLKESFGMASKELKEDLHNSTAMSNQILHELQPNKPTSSSNAIDNLSENSYENITNKALESISTELNEYPEVINEVSDDEDMLMADERVNSILNDIESEISKRNGVKPEHKRKISPSLSTNSINDFNKKNTNSQILFSKISKNTEENKITNFNSNLHSKPEYYDSKSSVISNSTRHRKSTNKRSNYSFIDLLEKNVQLSDDDEIEKEIGKTTSVFSDTIKSQLEKFLQKTKDNTNKQADKTMNDLLNNTTLSNVLDSEVMENFIETFADNQQKEETENRLSLEYPMVCINDNKTNNNKVQTTSEDMNLCNNYTKETGNQVDSAEMDALGIKSQQCDKICSSKKDITHQEHFSEVRTDIYSKSHENDVIDISEKECLHRDYITETEAIYHEEKQKADMNLNRKRKEESLILVEAEAFGKQCGKVNNDIKEESSIIAIYDANKRSNNYIITMGTVNTESKENKKLSNKKSYNIEEIKENMCNNVLVPINSQNLKRNSGLSNTFLKSQHSQITLQYNSFNLEKKKLSSTSMFKKINMNQDLNMIVKNHENKSLENDRMTNNCVIKKSPYKKGDFPKSISVSTTVLPYQFTTSKDPSPPDVLKIDYVNSFDREVNIKKENISNKFEHTNTGFLQQMPKGYATNNKKSTVSVSPLKQKECHNSSTNKTATKQQDYIKKYSFTATKINVCTKNTSQNQVQIIRKVKLDLDVTEIISKENINGPEYQTEGHGKTRKYIENNSEEKKCVQENNTEIIEERFPIKNIKENEHSEPIENNNRTKEKQSKERKKYRNNTEFKGTDVDKKDTESVETKIVQIAANLDEAKHNTCKENSKTELENILQKYSNILRKYNNDFKCNSEMKKVNNDFKKQITIKPKKPYKISDIHKFDIPFTNTLVVEASRAPIRSSNDTVISQIRASKTEIKPIELKKDQEYNFAQNTQNEDKLHEEILYREKNLQEILQCRSPLSELPQLNLQPEVDFKIDQSMFDPKTLLQCFNNNKNELEAKRAEVEIIPPPPEFCDSESVYSPAHYEDNYNIDEQDTQDCCIESSPQDEIEHAPVELDHGSIFEENDPCEIDELTPSKEIETWTLSRDENNEASVLFQLNNLLKSRTVMRKNSPRNNLAAYNARFGPRKAKLDHFLFTPKIKLRK